MEKAMSTNLRIIRFNYCAAAVVALTLALGILPAASASTGTLIITTNTTLTEDHYGNILIAASNVTLDCAGHLVVGPGEPGFSGGIEVGSGNSRVTVKRCRVTGFNVNGIYGGGGASDSRFEANVTYGNGNHGMHLDTGTRYVVQDNTSRGNGAIGIVLTGASDSWIVHNTVKDNQNWAGIALLEASHDNHVVNNTALRNNIGLVVDGGSNNQLLFNSLSLNTAQGAQLIRGANNNAIELNAMNRNLIGLEITDGSNSNQVSGNFANRNTSVGFKVYASNHNTFTLNLGDSNGEDGFLVLGGSSFNVLSLNSGHHNANVDALDDDSGTGNVWKKNNFGTTFGF
jgi:parallel beta-helix repeat protein